jgi:hypothetical protein
MMSNQMLLAGITVTGAIFFLLLGYLGARLLSRDRVQGTRGESKPVRLRPALRLFSEADFTYIERQPGYRPEIGRKLRAERARIFKSYLGQMGREFERLHHSLRALTLQAGADRPEISRALLEQQLLFSLLMTKARMRAALFQLGVKPVEVQGLVETLDRMQSQVNQLSNAAVASSAA